ncbi:hypothetical protein K456DRAFT_43318 [Colletotrichum gloeosporioides 23]|nr:hypothetical protein K456DRAFT_43318 [Colletotrichum gloeosporioides 23]
MAPSSRSSIVPLLVSAGTAFAITLILPCHWFRTRHDQETEPNPRLAGLVATAPPEPDAISMHGMTDALIPPEKTLRVPAPARVRIQLEGVVRKGKVLGSLNRPRHVSDLQRQSTPRLISVSFLAARHDPSKKQPLPNQTNTSYMERIMSGASIQVQNYRMHNVAASC